MGLGAIKDLCNKFRLERLVDRNTQENAVLDLVYTYAPELFGKCKTSVKPYSDHNYHLSVQNHHLIGQLDGSEFKIFNNIAIIHFFL